MRILIVEDRASLRRLLREAMHAAGYETVVAADLASAVEELAAQSFDLVLTDLKLPDGSGLEVLRAARGRDAGALVVVLTAFGSVGTAVEAMKLGAVDFLEKPFAVDDLLQRVGGWLAGSRRLADALELPEGQRIVGSDPGLHAALRLLDRVATTEATVLLRGESGTGKELFARALHARSRRAGGPFVALNCAAIPEALVENELFGHEKGSYTGAQRRAKGRFELAAGGTLLLDEIGELPLPVQAKVLRVIEERVFERLGSGEPVTADVRLVAATNRDLEQMVEDGTFRSDLYFRLDVFPIELPPLRQRLDDLAELTRHLVEQLASRHELEAPTFEQSALDMLRQYHWPGNVRQLSNFVERLLILRPGERLDAASLRAPIEDLQRRDEEAAVRTALERSGGDKQRAAEALGVSYRTLQRRVKQYGLQGYPRYDGEG